MKQFKLGLLPKVIIAIFVGTICGKFFPESVIKACVTFSGLFSELLAFIVPILIISLVGAAIADTRSNAGKMLIYTILLAWSSTVLCGIFGYNIADFLIPKIANQVTNVVSNESVEPFFSIKFPPIMDTMSALVLSFILGIGILSKATKVIHGFLQELREIVLMVLDKCIIPLLPLSVFCTFSKMSFLGTASKLIADFLPVMGLCIALTITWIIVLYLIAGAISKRNPFKLLKTMLPAYLTALATSSSAATLPVTLRQAHKLNLAPEVVDFTIPICANIHLSGGMIDVISLTVGVLFMTGGNYELSNFLNFIFMMSFTAVAAPGIPGGVIMIAQGLLVSALGFTPEQISLIIALYISIDAFGTAGNVTGDGALSVIVDNLLKKKAVEKDSIERP
ncbi:MAG: dicarboxylate/amino acid:cation symporter [Alistipes sp.]|nr:dicarboxylate/amino acid:cation symporter [Candidatus Alistipes equi]